jgi:benzil reductase ((S)-benzoin forming)
MPQIVVEIFVAVQVIIGNVLWEILTFQPVAWNITRVHNGMVLVLFSYKHKPKRKNMNTLITGTSSGLGFALAKEYLDNGSTVYGISRNFNDRLKEYENYHHLSHDLFELNDLPDKLKNFLKKINVLDLVVLNAGVLPNSTNMRKTSIDEVSGIMQVNVWANKVIIDTLIESVGEIHQVVAITSGSMINNARSLHIYSLSKSALNSLIKLYSGELPKTHFAALAPGIIDSGLQEYISRFPEDKNCPVIRKLKIMRSIGKMTDPRFAANYLVEAMGTILQKDSGSIMDVNEILFPDINLPGYEIIKSNGIEDYFTTEMAGHEQL